MSVSAHLYVLDFGRLIFEGTPEEMVESEIVRDAYLGSEGLPEMVAAEAEVLTRDGTYVWRADGTYAERRGRARGTFFSCSSSTSTPRSTISRPRGKLRADPVAGACIRFRLGGEPTDEGAGDVEEQRVQRGGDALGIEARIGEDTLHGVGDRNRCHVVHVARYVRRHPRVSAQHVDDVEQRVQLALPIADVVRWELDARIEVVGHQDQQRVLVGYPVVGRSERDVEPRRERPHGEPVDPALLDDLERGDDHALGHDAVGGGVDRYSTGRRERWPGRGGGHGARWYGAWRKRRRSGHVGRGTVQRR